MSKISHFLLAVVLALFSLSGATQNCFNIGFEDSSFVGWKGDTGTWNLSGENLVTGLGGLRHQIMYRTDTTDMWSDGNLVPVAPGSKFSARLGYGFTNGGGRVQQMSYQMTVEAANSLLVYAVAIVLNDGGHPQTQQPRFTVSVLDTMGNELDTVCGRVDYFADTSITGFQTSSLTNGGEAVLYRDWEFAGLDLLPFVGQDVIIQFKTRSCPFFAHFGYAYLDASCQAREIQVEYCLGKSDSIVFSAPLGFEYLWSTGDTTQSFSVPQDSADTLYTCTLTSTLTGCSFVLEAKPLPTFYIDEGFSVSSCGTATFTDTTNINKGTIQNWTWDFGDGSPLDTTDTAVATHTYVDPGVYTATLIADDGFGCNSDSIIIPVNIYFTPIANFGASTVCLGDSTAFFDSTEFSPDTSNVYSWLWRFGDGNTDTLQNPKHVYDTAGTYTVTLIADINANCTDSISKTITVLPLPVVDYTVLTADSCEPHEYQFADSTSVFSPFPIVSRRWEFGDGDSLITDSTTMHPFHTYLNDGQYDLKLWAQDSNGCVDSLVRLNYVEVYPIPVVDFTMSPSIRTTLSNSIIFFQDQSRHGDSYFWDFGDTLTRADTSDKPRDFYQYLYEETYTVWLTVTSEFGCIDSAFQLIEVIDDMIFIPNVITPNGDGLNDAFFIGRGVKHISDYQLRIWSRWGATVFDSNLPGEEWDGTVNGKLLPAGTYFYHLTYRDHQGTPRTANGDISIVR